MKVGGELTISRQEIMHRIQMSAFLPVLALPDDQIRTAQPGLLPDELGQFGGVVDEEQGE